MDYKEGGSAEQLRAFIERAIKKAKEDLPRKNLIKKRKEKAKNVSKRYGL